jgi:hypothetical protein
LVHLDPAVQQRCKASASLFLFSGGWHMATHLSTPAAREHYIRKCSCPGRCVFVPPPLLWPRVGPQQTSQSRTYSMLRKCLPWRPHSQRAAPRRPVPISALTPGQPPHEQLDSKARATLLAYSRPACGRNHLCLAPCSRHRPFTLGASPCQQHCQSLSPGAFGPTNHALTSVDLPTQLM